MPGRAYRDRTRGGKPTACNNDVDLDQAEVRSGTVFYKGRRPVRTRKIGEGSFGVVKLYIYPDGSELTVKKQPAEWDAIDNLPVAESLKSCALVDFKSVVDRKSAQVFTVMEHLQSDCWSIPSYQREEYAPEFAAFLIQTLDCVLSAGASFTDMKLANIGFKLCGDGKPVFRLLDLDGVNGSVSTFPAIEPWKTTFRSAEEKQLQTRYAFALAGYMFEWQNKDSWDFYHGSLAPLEERLNLLLGHAENTPTADVKYIIETHGIPVLTYLRDRDA